MSQTTKPSTLPRRLLPKLGVSLAIGLLLAWIVARGGVPLVPPRAAFEAVQWWAVPLYVVTLAITHFFRASRWRFLIAPAKRVPLSETLLLNWIGFFAIFALPLRLGEVVRPALTKMRQGVSISTGFGTVAVERVVDGVLTSLCVLWALFLLPDHAASDELTRSLTYYGYLAVAAFGTAFGGLLLFLWQRRLALSLLHHTIGRVAPKLAHNLADKVEAVADGVRAIAVPRLAIGFTLESLLYWLFNTLGMWLLALGCGIPMGFEHSVAIMGLYAIGILLPAGPGLFGNFQLALSVSLKLYFSAALVASQGAVYIFLMYVTQACLFTAAGVIPLYAMRLSLRDLLRTDAPGTSMESGHLARTQADDAHTTLRAASDK